jgi:fatty-acyl-CoA synthase
MAKRPQITGRMTIPEAFRAVAAWRGARLALVTPQQRITYLELDLRVSAVAAHLRGLGLSKGDRLVTLLWSQVEFVYLFLAAAELGLVIVPLPPRLRRSKLEAYLREIQPALVVASSEIEIPEGMECLQEMQRESATFRHIIITGSRAPEEQAMDGWLTAPAPGVEIRPATNAEDLLAVLYTSGTTGEPKGIMHNHRGLIGPVAASIRLREMWIDFLPTFRKVGRWLKVLVRYGLRLVNAAGKQQVFLSAMGMHLISGLEAMLQALLMGDVLVLVPRFHPARYLEAIDRERVTVLIGMPLAYRAMLSVKEFDRFRFSSLIICGVGSAPCPPELAREIRSRFRCAVHIGFGMTELGGGIAATDLEDSEVQQEETVGRPMPGIEVRIVDDQRNPLSADSVGELACRSETVMMGFFRDERDREAVVDGEGWFYTGDLAVMDEKGYVRIVGRKKDLIIRGGQNIYPARIENELEAMEGVREAAVVGLPDPLTGESVCAFVIPEAGAQLDEGKVQDFCRARLEIYEVPRQIFIMDDLPRGPTGEPRKLELLNIALKEGKPSGGSSAQPGLF